MKKIFYFVALVATVLFTSCGKSGQKLSADDEAALNALVIYLDDEVRKDSEFDEDFIYKGTKLEGRDIVITAVVDESDLPEGITVKSAFQISGQNMDAMVDQLAQGFFSEEVPAEAKPLLDVLHRCNSAIVMRFEGNISHEAVDIRIPSEKLPK